MAESIGTNETLGKMDILNFFLQSYFFGVSCIKPAFHLT